MKPICIWIPGQPARVTHQSGTRYSKFGPYKSPALKKEEKRLSACLIEHSPQEPLTGPISLSVRFAYLARRKADRQKWKITKPDTDNAIKTLKDCMTSCGFWQDDAQVAKESCEKFWSADPGIWIRIEELEDKKSD